MIEGGKRYLKFENGTDLIPCSCRNITVSQGKFYRTVNFKHLSTEGIKTCSS
jgi:hypothetical protein